MKIKLCGLLGLALLPTFTFVAGAVEQEPLMGHGIGASSCGTYVESRRIPRDSYDFRMKSWFSGFVSAYNFYSGKNQVKGKVDYDAVLVYLDKYCRENPLASVSIGATELISVLSKRN